MQVYCTTVSRGVSQGEHGALFKVDFLNNTSTKLLSYLDDIDYSGRGGDRGLRGLIHRNGLLYVAAANKILIITETGEILNSITNCNLGFLHDLQETEEGFLVVSTKYDAVLEYSFTTNSWINCYQLNIAGSFVKRNPKVQLQESNYWHLNSINDYYVSGLRTGGAYYLYNSALFITAPKGMHNWSLLMYNDTETNRLVVGKQNLKFEAGSFLRGLDNTDNHIVVGQSPASIIMLDYNLNVVSSIPLIENPNSSVQSLLCVKK